MADTSGLSQRSISAVLWGTSGSGVQIVLQFGIQVTLARLVGPEQYGLFAVAFIVASLGNFFSSIGLAYGLIQKRVVTEDDVRFVNFWQISLGSSVTVALFLLADTLSHFFNEPAVSPLVRAISITCLVHALAAPSLHLLKRNLDFKAIQIIRVVTYAIGYGVVGIPLAMSGLGATALIVALIVQTLGEMALLYWRTRHVLSLAVWHGDAPVMMRYALTVFATNLNNWALMNLSRVIVGRAFTSTSVGHFSIAYNFVTQLAATPINVLQPALFSASSRVQNELPQLRRAFLIMVAAVALFVAPAFAGMAAAPETVMLALYGEAWRDSAQVLRPLALAMPCYLVLAMATPMLWTSGRTKHEFLLQVPIVFVLVAATLAAAQHSLAAVAWATFAIFALRLIVIIAATCRALHLSSHELAGACRAGAAVTLIVACGVAVVDAVAAHHIGSRLVVLALDVASGLILQMIALRLVRPWLTEELLSLFGLLAARLPSSMIVASQYILPLRRSA